ncbi:hypothetical protein L7F22_029677 [Adiantum nelumboides]|nr:hypothetical protein [Adiantum nelumboides]
MSKATNFVNFGAQMEIPACFRNEYFTDKDFGDVFSALKSLNSVPAEMNMFASYTVMDALLYYLDRICVPHNGGLRKILIQEHHEVPFAAHPGINKTYRLLSATYFWPQMQQDVIKFVKACHSCQIMKASRHLSQGLLQPLPLPKERWRSISMDFITTLPRTTKERVYQILDEMLRHYIQIRLASWEECLPLVEFAYNNFRIESLIVDGVNYLHVKVAGLLFVATSRVNVSPSLVLELLQRIIRVAKDYLGVLNEESIRKNFVLVYELLDETIDFGYPQTTSTEVLKSYVFNEPIAIDAARIPNLGAAALFMQGSKRMPGTAVTKSVVANEPGGKKREEIFVDIIEKISVTFSSSGYILTSEVDGTIQMKSYLTGNPEIRLALNEDLSIGSGGGSNYEYGGSGGMGMVMLDDCNFHESVRLDDFDLDRTLTLVPPDGEFSVMNYRMTQEFKVPFKVYPTVVEAGGFKAELVLKVRAEFASTITANSVVLRVPLPKSTTRASFELELGASGQSTDFKESNKTIEWTLRKVVGGSEHVLRAKLTLSQERNVNLKKETGPVSMNFTIPMFNASRLQVRYLQIVKRSKAYNPYRWVRYVTHASSYVIRI